jgi:hypothetical protein
MGPKKAGLGGAETPQKKPCMIFWFGGCGGPAGGPLPLAPPGEIFQIGGMSDTVFQHLRALRLVVTEPQTCKKYRKKQQKTTTTVTILDMLTYSLSFLTPIFLFSANFYTF